jgi:hypothetical protein
MHRPVVEEPGYKIISWNKIKHDQSVVTYIATRAFFDICELMKDGIDLLL